MTLMVDGREYPAQLLSAEEARRVYEGYVRRNKDPALLQWIGTGMFKTSVFPIPAGATRTVTLSYSQICRQSAGLTDWLFPLSTAKFTSGPIETVSVDVAIRSQIPIKNAYSPTHAVKIERPSKQTAKIQYRGTNEIPAGDFRFFYDVGDQEVAASLLSYRADATDDGYFLLLVSPDIKRSETTKTRKTVVFVVDRSGSMSGKKIEQAKGALKFVLDNLREGDSFNIIAYDSAIESFQPELQRYNDQTRAQALAFVDGLHAGGSTNIDGALQLALNQLKETDSPNYIVFLTDGLPTAGERNEAKIVANAKRANVARARIFSFGVGYDVNSRMLDRLSRACFGKSQYVRPNEDIEEQVAQLYRRIGTPVLVNVKIDVELDEAGDEPGAAINRMYPRDEYDLFAGDQLVIVGRYRRAGAAKITVRGTLDGSEQAFQFAGQLVERSADDSQAFVEKLWAIRRVGQIIDEIDLEGKNQELLDELVRLATKHGILTPYTSFLADDQANVRDLAANRVHAARQLQQLELESGDRAFGQRVAKGVLLGAQRAVPATSLGSALSGSGPTAGGSVGAHPAPAAGAAARVARRIRSVGSKTLYWHNDRWEDAALTDALLTKAKKIKRFSPEYFALIDQHGSEVAKYLAVDEPVVIVVDSQAYELEN